MPTERLCFLLRRWNARDTVRVKLWKLKLLHEVSRTAAYYAGTGAEGAEGGSLLRPLRPAHIRKTMWVKWGNQRSAVKNSERRPRTWIPTPVTHIAHSSDMYLQMAHRYLRKTEPEICLSLCFGGSASPSRN